VVVCVSVYVCVYVCVRMPERVTCVADAAGDGVCQPAAGAVVVDILMTVNRKGKYMRYQCVYGTNM